MLAELQADSVQGEEYSADIPVEPEVVHREMSEAGLSYYTGKREHLLHGRGTPPEIYRAVEPDGTQVEFSLLGVSEPGYTAHYTRIGDSNVEVMQRVWHRTGELGHRKDSKVFDQFPAVQLENYVEEYNWQYLEEPDYESLRERYRSEIGSDERSWDLDGTRQTGFEDF